MEVATLQNTLATVVFNFLKWGVFCSPFLFTACSSNPLTIVETCNQCEAVEFERVQANTAVDSISFERRDSLGELSSNIPPKQIGHSMILFTEKNYLVYYESVDGKNFRPIEHVLQLPPIHESVSDFLITGDNRMLITWNDNPEIFTWYNPQTGKHIDLRFSKSSVGKIAPFLNFGLTAYTGHLLLPIVSYDDASAKNNVFGLFDQDLNYLKGLANYENHDAELFAPFSDSPITSRIQNDEFFVSSSVVNGAVKFNLKTNRHESIPVCFSSQLAKILKKDIARGELGDFKVLDEKYVVNPYVIGLHATSEKLVRIAKHQQPFFNTASGLKNTMLNARWSMEVLDLKSKKGHIHYFNPNEYVFTNVITTNKTVYILSAKNQKTFTYYAFF